MSCPFCAYVAGRFSQRLVIYQDEHVLVVPSLRQRPGKATALAFEADGVSVRQNNGVASDQDVFHLHVHVIPRFTGDVADAAYIRVDEAMRLEQADALRRAWRG